MATLTQTRKSVKRTVKLALRPFEDHPGVLAITHHFPRKGPQTVNYFLTMLGSDFGTAAFELEKIDPRPGEEERYHTLLSEADGHHLCDCQGHAKWHHCKHVESLLALRKAGKL
jgi:hypothetical protein